MRFLPMYFPPQIAKPLPSQRPSDISFAMVRAMELWTCKVGSRNSAAKRRSEMATDSAPNRQRRAKSGGMGGSGLFWGRGAGKANPPERNLPNLCLHQLCRMLSQLQTARQAFEGRVEPSKQAWHASSAGGKITAIFFWAVKVTAATAGNRMMVHSKPHHQSNGA